MKTTSLIDQMWEGIRQFEAEYNAAFPNSQALNTIRKYWNEPKSRPRKSPAKKKN